MRKLFGDSVSRKQQKTIQVITRMKVVNDAKAKPSELLLVGFVPDVKARVFQERLLVKKGSGLLNMSLSSLLDSSVNQ